MERFHRPATAIPSICERLNASWGWACISAVILAPCHCIANFRSRLGGGDRFDDWVVGLQFEPYYLHHPVSANRRFPARRQIGRFCGDFRPLISQILVSVGVRAFYWRFLALCLRIQKFRSRRSGLSTKFGRVCTRNSGSWTRALAIPG